MEKWTAQQPKPCLETLTEDFKEIEASTPTHEKKKI